MQAKERPLQDLAPVPESGRIDEPQGTPMATSSRKRESMVVGDSIIQGVDSIVCAREKDSRTVCCLPGAQVGDILERGDKLLAKAGRDPVVMVHVGTNDIGKGRFEVLQEKMVELVENKSSTSTVVLSGVLPAPRASRGKQNVICFWDRGGHLIQRGTFAMGQHILGNWGAGRIESEMGREAQTAQMDIVKATYNGESLDKKTFRVKILILVSVTCDSRECGNRRGWVETTD